MNDLVDVDEQPAILRRDADRLARCIETGDLATPVASCPGWDLRRLGSHTGFVHRWATLAIKTSAPPDAGAIAEPEHDSDGAMLGEWLRSGADALATALETTSADAPTWHPFPLEQRAWVWSRRQMIETTVHRWDAEVTAIGSSEIETRVAATGIAEYFELGLPRVLMREVAAVPVTSLQVQCTDDGLPEGSGEWVVWSENGDYRVAAEHRRSDAALRGPAADVLLVLMGRGDRSSLDIVGDHDAAASWLDLPGW